MGDSEREPGTEEFEKIRILSPSVEFDLYWESHLRLPIRYDFTHPIEITLGDGPLTSPCYLVHGREHPDIRARYLLVQPDVFADDPRRGRVAIGAPGRSEVSLGREASPALRLGPEVSRDHCIIDALGDDLIVEDYSFNGTRVKLHPDDLDDVPFSWFNRDKGLGHGRKR